MKCLFKVHNEHISALTDELMKYIIKHFFSVKQRLKFFCAPVSSQLNLKLTVRAAVMHVTPPCGHKMAA